MTDRAQKWLQTLVSPVLTIALVAGAYLLAIDRSSAVGEYRDATSEYRLERIEAKVDRLAESLAATREEVAGVRALVTPAAK